MFGKECQRPLSLFSCWGTRLQLGQGRLRWPAIVDCAAASRKLGGKSAGKEAHKTAAREANKAQAPIENRGWGSKKSAVMWSFSGGNKSAASGSTRADREAKGAAANKRGSSLGGQVNGPKNLVGARKARRAAQKAKTFSHPISLFSHECKEPKCRQPAKITYRGVNSAVTMQHRCSLKLGNKLGLSNHMCSTCHKLCTDCRVAPC